MIKKLFKQMIISQIVSALSITVCLLVDSIMIGRFLGVDSVAAYGLANPVLLVFAAFGSMLSCGIQVVCSKSMGNGDKTSINKFYTVSIVVATTFSVIAITLVVIFMDPLCEMLGAEPGTEVFKLTKRYLLGFLLGGPAFIAAQMMVPYLQMAGERVRLIVAVLCMTVMDIILDLLNVHLFKQDMFGMGLASTISYYVAITFGLAYFLGKKCIYKFQKKLIDLKAIGQIALGGVPTVINQISLVLLVFTINKVLIKSSGSTGGNIAVAAFSIVSTIANLGYCIGNGVSEVSLMLSGLSYEEEDDHSLTDIVKTQTFFATLLGGASMAVFLIFAGPIVRLFLDNPDAEGAAIWGLRMFAISLIPSSINAAFKKYYQAISRVRFSESISVVQNFLFPAIVVLTLGNIFGDKGVWWYYIIGETLSIVYITIATHIMSKKKFLSLESLVCLPSGFGSKPGDVMEFTILDKSEVSTASSAAGLFCTKKGQGKKKSMYTSLCIEELANNIIQYGFEKPGQNRIDIRLVKKKKTMLIRIRDNCKGFDPVKFLEMSRTQTDDPAKHIGIRMTLKIVKKVQYVNSLGLNNLTLEI